MLGLGIAKAAVKGGLDVAKSKIESKARERIANTTGFWSSVSAIVSNVMGDFIAKPFLVVWSLIIAGSTYAIVAKLGPFMSAEQTEMFWQLGMGLAVATFCARVLGSLGIWIKELIVLIHHKPKRKK